MLVMTETAVERTGTIFGFVLTLYVGDSYTKCSKIKENIRKKNERMFGFSVQWSLMICWNYKIP